ncbi:hypothetical protein E0Z10_g2601 [Xylaria hypoxylon]|uniref:Heterokaryon incompatibility domain-containing protein n=1 Tax=Xylaria hypoxylon TaxID=37992 RepID=A0A4Z0Z1R9_9PEZI|nr:hypothetical protein E0Z10_g2601 [Xylaria hypoxylon]
MAPCSPDQNLNIAELCASCEEAALFKDDQEFLEEYEELGSTTRLVASEDTAIRTSRLNHLRDDTLPSLPLLAESARRGCGFCDFLRSVIICGDTQDEIQKLFGSTGTDEEPLEISISIHFRWKYHSEHDIRGDGLLGAIILLCFDDGKVEITLFCLAEGLTGGSETSDRWLGLAAPPSQSFSQKHRLDWMMQTLAECTEKHQHDHLGKDFLPERLISVQEPVPRLVLGADLTTIGAGAQKPRYAALSYCWGPIEESKSQLKTTTSSIAQRQTAITDAEMTEVLRDSVTMTRALSIPYLWVDALCILQDDISDWERQCRDMAELYQSAHIVLCAASSASCLQGFLGQRGRRIRVPFRSARRPSVTGSYYLQFKYAGCSRGVIFSEATADTQHNRWGNRGWVFQESWSASRRLVFGNSNLHLYCPWGVQSSGRPKEMEAGERESNENDRSLSGLGAFSKDQLYTSWALLVRSYSRFEEHSFTKATDILPALSGLASKYHEYIHDVYHAGLWKGDLFRGLMWYWDGDSETLPERLCCLPNAFMRHNDCPIPSWSPLARGLFVTHGAIYKSDECLTSFQPEYMVLEATTEPVGNNPFGAIQKSWSLRIHSYVLDLATLNPRSLIVSEDFAGGEGSRGSLIYEGRHLGCFELDFVYDTDDNFFNSESFTVPACMLDEISRFKWVLLGSCKVRGLEEPPDKVRRARGACGLILFSPPGSDSFHRVGVFFPGLPDNHHDGLRLIRKLGEVRTVIVT